MASIFTEDPKWTKDYFKSSRFACNHKLTTHMTTVTKETATPYSVFWEEFMPDSILDIIVHETNTYQEQHPIRDAKKCHQKPWRPVDREEISVLGGHHDYGLPYYA